ncbi:hypothetical protein [Rubrivirga sp.]|uniref:hypothetical protein n=1 Tax=Rubrivirga sp. TaxID=1885344 RepID=UPI003B517BD5
MKKTYTSPALEPIGGITSLTAAFGTSPAPDVSEFPQIPADEGSFDICRNLVCDAAE